MIFENTIPSTILRNAVAVAAASTLIIGGLWLRSEYVRFREDSDKLRTTLTEERKRELRDHVDRTLGFIEFMKSKTEGRAKESTRSRVQEAHALVSRIWEVSRGKRSRAEIDTTIRESLRAIRFNEGRGYYFCVSLDGTNQLGDPTDLEGKNVLDVRDPRGALLFRDMIALARTQGEGFYAYVWPKGSAAAKHFRKVSFVKLFQPLGWVIGSGEYLDEVEAQIQREALERIERIRFGQDGYVFVGSWDGLVLTPPAKGRNLLDLADPNGVKIVRDLIARAKGAGGFVRYVMPGLEGRRSAPKISYARGVPEWRWFVGAGMYLDDIEESIAQARAVARERMLWSVGKSLGLMAALLIGALWAAAHTAGKTRRTFQAFSSFFRDAATESARIDPEGLAFAELRELAQSANRMLSERRSSELALKENEEKYRRLFDLGSDAIFLIDNETGQILEVNTTALAMYGFAREEILSKRNADLSAEPAFTRRATEERQERIPVRWHRKKDGTVFPVEITANHFTWKGRPVHIAAIRDITDRMRAEKEKAVLEAQLRQAQKMEAVGTLAGGIAHDFNNLLQAISGRIELLQRSQARRSSLEDDLRVMSQAVDRGAGLVRGLLTFAHKGEPERRTIYLNEEIRLAVRMLDRTIPKMIAIETELADDLLPISADPSQLEQILICLAANSKDAMPQGGRLVFRTRNAATDAEFRRKHPGAEAAGYVELSVEDTGTGMSEATASRIFDPFFTTKEVGQGTGLGVSVVYGIVKEHRGEIDVVTAPGQGTTFHIYLPALASRADTTAAQAAPQREGTILVVDDEQTIREMTKEGLEDAGFKVLTAASGEECLDLYRSACGSVDLVVLDLGMPGLGGHACAQALREMDPCATILVASGYGPPQASDFGAAETTDFIQKPYRIAHIAQKIRHLISQKTETGG